MSQENSLYSYLKQKVFYFKTGDQEAEQILSGESVPVEGS
jgi:hypothetical protein